MTRRLTRIQTLLKVSGIRKKQAEAALAGHRADLDRAEAQRQDNVRRLAETSALPAGTVSSLEQKRQRTDLRIDAVLASNENVEVTTQMVEEARLRWQAAARQRRSMEELDKRERAVQAILAARAAERAVDDALRARRRAPSEGASE